MVAVKVLLILLLTLFWAGISFLISREATSYTPLVIVTAIYCALLYMVWPLGTEYSDVAGNRFLFVLGGGAILLALNMVRTHDCSSFGVGPGPSDSDMFDAVVALTCHRFGAVPASLIIGAVGAYLIYHGVVSKPDIQRNRNWRDDDWDLLM